MSDSNDRGSIGGYSLGLGMRAANRSTPPEVWFDRREINAILGVYGRKVAAGEWRDYAIDHRRGEAVFSIFRRTSEVPLYRIVKNPQLARRQGAYAVLSVGGQILKRGHDLNQVLFALDRGPKLVRA